MRLLSLLPILWAAALCSCSPNGARERSSASSAAAETASETAVAELPLPEVPPTLTAPAERADYILAHFWDGMDFDDPGRAHDSLFMEQNTVNYLSLVPHGSEGAAARSLGALLGRAAADSVTFALLTGLMERYLDDPNSPMRNETSYILYLEELLRLPGLSEYDRLRPAYKLETARKNRPGTVAADFAYIDRSGRRRTLHATPGERLLLIFYDPECLHCADILREVYASYVLRNRIAEKSLTVLAVYTEGNRTLWDETKGSMPQEWTVGFDLDGIVDRELYSIPAMPVMYLLDRNKTVLLKDTLLPALESELVYE